MVNSDIQLSMKQPSLLLGSKNLEMVQKTTVPAIIQVSGKRSTPLEIGSVYTLPWPSFYDFG